MRVCLACGGGAQEICSCRRLSEDPDYSHSDHNDRVIFCSSQGQRDGRTDAEADLCDLPAAAAPPPRKRDSKA